MNTKIETYADRLRDEADVLLSAGVTLLEVSDIQYVGDFNRGGSVVFIAPDYRWCEPTDEVRRIQMALVPRFDRWFERYRLVFRDAPAELAHEIDELRGQVRDWLARDGGGNAGWDLPPAIAEAQPVLRERLEKLRSLLDIVAPPGASGPVIAIPDTSALIDRPDIESYPAALGIDALDVVLVPAVLSELDSLKDQGRTGEVREKARRTVRAIKDIRSRGSLVDGVSLAHGLRVTSRPQEPSFEGLPGRLDRSIPDDRILASAYDLQREHPAQAVVLITGDVNLQTKAEVAGFPFVETPT